MMDYINQNTTHQCEIIKLPAKETNFWDLINSYYSFYKLDVSHFDLVISSKYPAWMLKHKNHHIYMLHCLRGLYDTYKYFIDLPSTCNIKHTKVCLIYTLIKQNTDLDTFFTALFSLQQDYTIPKEAFIFPGPFIRDIIHFLDQKAFHEIKSFSALSNTVAKREGYFPLNVDISVIHPPSNLTTFKSKAYRYFFTVSRLDSPKRIDMLIKAYRESKTDIPLKIAGSGPMHEKLVLLAGDDPRIEFVGFVSDRQLEAYYADAYAVIFIPLDEDFGLVTIEAMKCAKPVVTFSDTGAVTEFVEDGVTGYVCAPKVDCLLKIIDKISLDTDKCIAMGMNARAKVMDITWENFVDKLIEKIISVKTSLPNKISVISPYSVFPPLNGGQNRTYYLYLEIAKVIPVDIIALCHESEVYSEQYITHNLREIRVPKTHEHAVAQWEIEKDAGIPISDIALLNLYNKTPQFLNAIQAAAFGSDLLVCNQVYTYNLIKALNLNIPLIHDSQNVEYLLKQQMLAKSEFNDNLLNILYKAESAVCSETSLTITCSDVDAKNLSEIYSINSDKMVVVANGVDINSVHFITKSERSHAKASLGFKNQQIVLFIGSWHQPNLEAIQEILKLALQMPEYMFIILGSAGDYFKNISKPANIGFAGVVSDCEKLLYYTLADVAINPMLTGSGTNLKMLDYMASGIPVVTTEVGARGLDFPAGLVVVSALADFPYHIEHIDDLVDVELARNFVRHKYSWENIAKNYLSKLKEIKL